MLVLWIEKEAQEVFSLGRQFFTFFFMKLYIFRRGVEGREEEVKQVLMRVVKQMFVLMMMRMKNKYIE
jgi:hypothetical protein